MKTVHDSLPQWCLESREEGADGLRKHAQEAREGGTEGRRPPENQRQGDDEDGAFEEDGPEGEETRPPEAEAPVDRGHLGESFPTSITCKIWLRYSRERA